MVGKAYVDGTLVAEGTVLCKVVDRPAPAPDSPSASALTSPLES
jgi:hypothetical protein